MARSEKMITQGKTVPRIQRLPSQLINQIAAGEVVERPSNLIKELVENSLDAGASRIEVHLIEGGLKELTVIDNGCGITEEDLPLAIERHTTSKLKELSDLDVIGTYGFRGEALSSIASVSDFSIRTRTQLADRGVSLHVAFGENLGLKPVGCPPGTQVTAKDLFGRIPARFKFLRSQATELSHCVKTLKELALGNPEVTFFLHHNERLLCQYTATTRLERVKECLKPGWEPSRFKDSIEEMNYEAFLSPPEWAQERGELTLIVNQRPVKNRILLSSIKNSFSDLLGQNLEVSGVFYLDIQGDWVDVNVHPQKLEVRLYRQEKIYSWLLTSLRKQIPPPSSLGVNKQTTEQTKWDLSNYRVPDSNAFRWIGPLTSTLLIFERTGHSSELYIVNSRALKKRSLFQRLKTISSNEAHPSEKLPIAEIINLSPSQWKTMETLLPSLSRLGFEIEPYGDKDIALKSVPDYFLQKEIKSNFLNLMSEISLLSFQDKEEIEEALLGVLVRLACFNVSACGVGPEIMEIMSKIENMDETWTCPDGNPVLLKITGEKLRQHFKEL